MSRKRKVDGRTKRQLYAHPLGSIKGECHLDKKIHNTIDNFIVRLGGKFGKVWLMLWKH
jgi:hypothetical protein